MLLGKQELSISLPTSIPIRLPLSFNIEIDKAKKNKSNLRTLWIASFFEPDDYNKNLKLSLNEIWIYDITTGEIFLKQKIDLFKIIEDAKKREKEKQEQERERLINQIINAKKLYETGDDEGTMAELRQILVSDPRNAEAYLILGKIHIRRGDLEQAISSLKTAIFWDNRLIEAHILLGNIYLEKSDCKTAQTYSNSAFTLDSTNQEAIALNTKISEACNIVRDRLSTSTVSDDKDILEVGSLMDYATQRVAPTYPQQARTIRQTGIVKVEVVIDEEGKVVEVKKTSGPSLLQGAAKDAAKKWRFKPFLRDGQPVRATGFISFIFNL